MSAHDTSSQIGLLVHQSNVAPIQYLVTVCEAEVSCTRGVMNRYAQTSGAQTEMCQDHQINASKVGWVSALVYGAAFLFDTFGSALAVYNV